MKKNILSVLAILVIAGCSEQKIDTNAGAEIKLSAGIKQVTTKGAIDTWANTPVSFAKGSATNKYLDTWDATISADGDVTLNPTRYYPPTAKEQIFLRGYAPQGTFTGGSVVFSRNINGTQDILLSDEKSGGVLDRFTPEKSFTFSHLLTQLNFTIVADQSFADGANLTSIQVNGTKLPLAMNVESGIITYAATSAPIISFADTKAITSTVSKPFGTVMVEPQRPITLTIVAGGVTYTNIAVTIDDDVTPQVGTAYTIALTFKSVAIDAKATVTPWKAGSGSATVI